MISLCLILRMAQNSPNLDFPPARRPRIRQIDPKYSVSGSRSLHTKAIYLFPNVKSRTRGLHRTPKTGTMMSSLYNTPTVINFGTEIQPYMDRSRTLHAVHAVAIPYQTLRDSGNVRCHETMCLWGVLEALGFQPHSFCTPIRLNLWTTTVMTSICSCEPMDVG
jgi:hypothetical protein